MFSSMKSGVVVKRENWFRDVFVMAVVVDVDENGNDSGDDGLFPSLRVWNVWKPIVDKLRRVGV